ncbi:MAG: signal transduction histidine kinase [Rhodomicrobiaceae bacterium]
MQLTGLTVDESSHGKDGLLLHGWAGERVVSAFIGRRAMDIWVNSAQSDPKRKSLFRVEYNELGKRNVEMIERIARLKYRRGRTFNREQPLVEILPADIAESGELLDMQDLARQRDE